MASNTPPDLKPLSAAASEPGQSVPAGNAPRLRPRPAIWKSIDLRHYGITCLLVLSCGLIGVAARAMTLSETNIVMIYMAAVAFVAARFGRGPAIFAAIFGAVEFDFFFVAPFMSFAPSDVQYFVTFAVMLGFGILISTLTSRVHAQLHASQEQEHRTAQLYRMTRELSTLSGAENLVAVAGRLLCDIFSADVLLYFREADGSLKLLFGQSASSSEQPVDLAAAAEWVLKHKKSAGLGSDHLHAATALLVPMIGSQRTIGVLGVRPNNPAAFDDEEQRRMLETCVSLIALSIERDQLFLEAQQALVQVQSEQLRNSLLSAVSHDLRTPLATIAVSASSLLEDSTNHTEISRTEMVQTVVDESRRAARQVDNLLNMARLNAGPLEIHREWEVLEELVGVSLSRLRRELAGHVVSVQIGADFPLVWVAGDLVEQVLVNLLENAIRYTPAASRIEIAAHKQGAFVEISVADNGPGLPAGTETKVFQRFFRGGTVVADGQRGIGLGLSICRAIVQAHGGEVRASNRESGGAMFVMSLPCPPESPHVTMDETSTSTV